VVTLHWADLSCQSIKLFDKRHGFATFEIELAFADHVDQFNAGEDVPRGLKGLKSEHRFGDALDRTMVLLSILLRYLTRRTMIGIPLSSMT
jgi:hypothetical protein